MSRILHSPDDRAWNLGNPDATLAGDLSKVRHATREAEEIFGEWSEIEDAIVDELLRRGIDPEGEP
jgi:hypothetical protein